MIIAGNWKMNLTREGAGALAGEVAKMERGGVEVILFPSFTLLDVAADAVKGSGVMVGGQDCSHEGEGAHTGDVSAGMLADAGCDWVLVGHSERRQGHGETSAMVAAKATSAIAEGLRVMVCVGETLADREAGKADAVVKKQLAESLPDGATGIAIAYEPVWAIGTGKTAELDDIAAMHEMIAAEVAAPVLYGGSVKPDNAAGILALDNVGGALVGGASLDAADFAAIINAARNP